jgi:type IV pilus assembly protein PilM
LFRVLEAVETAGLKCAVVDVSGFALANCFEANYGVLSETVAVLNIGAGVTNLVVIDRGEVIFCRDVAIGGGHYTAEISKAMGVSLGEAEALKISASLGQEVPEEVNGILAGANDQVADEIRNSLEFFNATSGQGHSISRLFVCGGSIFVPGLLDHMSRSIGLPLQVFDPFTRIGYDSRALSADYISQIKAISAVALGLALRKIGD